MPSLPGKDHYRRDDIRPLAQGINDSPNPLLLEGGQSPDARNIDFNRESVASSGGAIKFGNRPAPHAGLRTVAGFGALKVEADKSVPQRGYGFIPYDAATDLGGDFARDVGGTPFDHANHTFHTRRGRSFEFSISFSLPIEEKLYNRKVSAGVNTADAGVGTSIDFYDEALDECSLIAQKGGDGLSPLSWALGIVNTGGLYESNTGIAAANRVSDYALCFMWLDAPEWGGGPPSAMRYRLDNGAVVGGGTTQRYCTMGLRVLVAKYFIEPGRTYHVHVALKTDTGSPGTGATPTTAWNSDGIFRIVVRDEFGSTTTMDSSATLSQWKGPQDSLEYLKHYGVRFSGRDPMFIGLGYRFAPWLGQGFAPYGIDSAPMEKGGFRMIDVGSTARPAGYIDHELSWTSPNSFVTILINGAASQGMHSGTATNLPDPIQPTDATPWMGLFDTVGAVVPHQGTLGQSEALRGCYAVLWGGHIAPDTEFNGRRIYISHYFESGGTFRFDLGGSALSALASFTRESFFIQVLRWHQRDLIVSNFRMWDASSATRDFTQARTQFSLGSYSQTDDETEPDRERLIACWPLDDAGGGVLREIVSGRNGYLAPYQLGQSGGVFLSGEGEALTLDLSENPVFEREFKELLRSRHGGFAIEIKLRIPQAYYSRALTVGSEFMPEHAPILASWETKSDDTGNETQPNPIIQLSHRARIATAIGAEPFFWPAGFQLSVGTANDQAVTGIDETLTTWPGAATPRWSTGAEWVGQSIRIQVGVQSSGTDDTFTCYIAAWPKSLLLPAAGDPLDSEMGYFANRSISKRDLVRSVITIGGAWRPESRGYLENNARMIVEEVRVFGCAAPGGLPPSSGLTSLNRNGKLVGDRCLPARTLKRADLLLPLGPSRPLVNVTDGSAVVTPSTSTPFFAGEPEITVDAVKETFISIQGDGIVVVKEGENARRQEEFYFVSSVAAGGASLSLSRPFGDRSQSAAYATSFRIVGYSTFGDDISQKRLSLGGGTPFTPGTSQPSDSVLSGPFFKNLAPISADWRLRVMSGESNARDISPRWVRGLCTPRLNPVLGLASLGDRLFAATRGCLFEADDRWRDDGPTDDLERSLMVRARGGLTDIAAPEEDDFTLFASSTSARFTSINNGGGTSTPTHFDAWVKIDRYYAYQTVLWIGSLTSDPADFAGTAAGSHGVNVWLRLASGYPELAIGSTAAYTGVTRPEKGLFVARASIRVPLGKWTHIRFTLQKGTVNGVVSQAVKPYIDGKPCAVTLLASEVGLAAGDWLAVANIVAPSAAVVLLGCARDSYVLPETEDQFVDGALGGRGLGRERYHGFVHSLGGQLAGVVISSNTASAAFPTFFSPEELDYSALTLKFSTLTAPEGVGHKILDAGGVQYGVVYSHPAVSVFHELGVNGGPSSWARYGNRLIVTNGGRPAYVQLIEE